MKDGVCLRLFFDEGECFGGWNDDEFDVAAFGFAFYFFHDGQAAVGSGADDEALALPGDLFFEGQGRVAELVAEFLGRGFPALADFAAVDDDVVVDGRAVDLDSAEGEFAEVHGAAPSAFLRGDG